ncbi:YaaA family protein [Corynebacterium uterequi]|uniref:Peroxide stress protein YaaA n=1 Tax=Corynebacterium uterequi TaxID=1072256 RepID=A0A0G3HDE5_9CORY|nr:peroxide stress protein YaaA [Corynebacterium uterequi]AKK11334.1 hypothetical protein CUTER_06725 [Corynebacterium uterequi]
MLIILPPSETKAAGGDHPPLDLGALSFPGLTTVRRGLIEELASLSVDDTMAQLGLSEKLREQAAANQRLLSAPTLPAIHRYTGVLYDALDAGTLSDVSNLAIGSALFGVVRATDLIPCYRLSGGSKINGRTIKSRWGRTLSSELADVDELILDLRSGAYLSLGPAPEAVTLRVENPDGRVVSHFNKHYKGLVARHLAGVDAGGADEVVELLDAAGFDVRLDGSRITLVVG